MKQAPKDGSVMDPKRKRGRPRTVERENTIQRAMETYWREGVHNLSINEICRRTYLSKPSLYREFGGEDGLIKAALAAYEKVVAAPLSAGIKPALSFAQALNNTVDQLTKWRDAPPGCLLVKVRDSPGSQGPLTQAAVADRVARILDGYAGLYQYAHARGETRPGIGTELAARYIDTQITTILRRMAAGDPADQIAAEGKLALSVLLANAHASAC